jgi:predicted nucleic acid-binding protein
VQESSAQTIRGLLVRQGDRLVTTDHVLVETWLLLRHRLHRKAAEQFWESLRAGVASIESVSAADMETAWAIGQSFADQDFSIVDRSTFAVMQRLGIERVATFADDFAVFRYGRNRNRAFEVVR